jgi:hypothetical protein
VTGRLLRAWALIGMSQLLFGCGPGSGTPPAPQAAQATPPAGQLLWPAPADPLPLVLKAGLVAEKKETLTFHVHAHLDVFVDGGHVIVPAGIGINIQDPAVQRFDFAGTDAYGRIKGCAQPCISPLHTHDQSGVIHTEAGNPTPNRLGAFFAEWDLPFTSSCVGQYCQPTTPVAVYVNGQRHSGNPSTITLTDREEIAVVIGANPPHIPSVFPSDAPA